MDREWRLNGEGIDKNQTKNYIGRYLKKPPIAASRLKHIYGGDVTFEYLDHRDKQHKQLAVSQTEMMLRLLSHIPEKHFKMIRCNSKNYLSKWKILRLKLIRRLYQFC